MNAETIQSLVPDNFQDSSRVWVYQSSRPFSEKEAREINEQLYQFYVQWQAHGAAVKGWAGLLWDRFIVMMADESEVPVSGCSTDSSVRIIKSIERQYEVTLFDRLSLTFLVEGHPEVLPMEQIQYALNRGFINENTLMFNNLVGTKKELCHNWLVPLKDSWMKNRLVFPEKE